MIERLVGIMARLRGPDGCAWDRAQTWATIAPYTIEEAYEVADAIERNAPADLRDELGDLLLQVVFHSRIAEEAGAFTVADVVTAISDKMERRHPHIFSDAIDTPGWEALKAAERRGHDDQSALADVALGMPALSRAEKLQKRAARTGFDWPDPEGPLAKIREELEEIASAEPADIEEEVGDLLFAAVNYARHLGVNAEAALQRANGKFERRFRAMEAIAGGAFARLNINRKEALWERVKRDQSAGRSLQLDR